MRETCKCYEVSLYFNLTPIPAAAIIEALKVNTLSAETTLAWLCLFHSFNLSFGWFKKKSREVKNNDSLHIQESFLAFVY